MKKLTASILFLIALLLGPNGNAATRGSIYVGPMASGEAVRILSTGYTLQPLTNACPDCLGIVVGPADLSNPSIVNRLQAAYEAGHAVGLTDATVASIRQLHDLLGHRGSAEPVPGGVQVDLVAFRKAQRSDGQFHFSSHLMLPRETAGTTPLGKKAKKQFAQLPKKVKQKLRNRAKRVQRQQPGLADRNDIQALSRIFSATPEVPEPPPGVGGSPQQNLLQLAESYQSHAFQSDPYGNQVQLLNSIWAARSFTNSADLYYVLQETDYHIVPQIVSGGLPFFLNNWTNSATALPFEPNPTLIQPSPQTTMEATQDISSTSYTIGGSAGWNETQGLNASVSGSVTVSNEKVTTIPPINITNDANLQTGQTLWHYQVNELPKQAETIDLFGQWIWSIPFSDYHNWQTQFQFNSWANLYAKFVFIIPIVGKPVTANFIAQVITTVPLPFGRTFALQQPAVISVNPTSVNAGDTFTINGTGFYPSLVQSVLIGGTAMNQANITAVSDTQINVVAPDFLTCELGCTVVVQTTQGASNDNVSISIIPNP